MKTILKYAFVLFAVSLLSACSDFEEINVDPKAASLEQVQVEYILNNSIIGAQQDPHVAERVFVLYWKTASRQQRGNSSLALGGYNDGWSSDYYSYLSGWLNSANLAVKVAKEKIETGSAKPYTTNLLQIARIWRVYLMSEFADNFGPMPIDGFNGTNPKFSSQKDVYYFLLSELADASSKIDVSLARPDGIKKYDQSYGFDYTKWKKYGNSLRLRLAMRLSEVDPAKAKSEFEAAAIAAGGLITSADDIFKVAERSGWDPLTGVMSREWNGQHLSATLNNLFIGLGGIKSADVLPAKMHSKIKTDNYMGLKFANHLTTMTNDPSAGYWFDGLHEKMDPRAYKAFYVPGDFESPNFSHYPSWTNDAKTVNRNLVDGSGAVVKTIDGTFTWNAACLGNWGTKSAQNQVSFYTGTNPRLSHQFRTSTSARIFFADWETHFLLAEGALKGWSTPVSAKVSYENGVKASFAYWGLTSLVSSYLSSEEYNRAGTSVKFDHTAEPVNGKVMNFVDGYTGTAGTVSYNYPNNTIYKNGTVKNDLLTKIITQKYLAQLPWLPLEAWNDHRRLGLPFFENPAVDLPLVDMPDITTGNYTTNSVKNFPQRLRYPSGLANSNAEGYAQAVGFLGGADAVLTPLWWAKKQ